MSRARPQGPPHMRVLARDWPRLGWTEADCRIVESRCQVHGRRREAARSGSCSVGRARLPMQQALELADSGGPREMAVLAAACRTELEIACFAEVCGSRVGKVPAAAARALGAAARRSVPLEEVISRVRSLPELFLVRDWCPFVLTDRGHPRPELADLVSLREVTLWGEIAGGGAERLGEWADQHLLHYLGFAYSGGETGGRLFQDAVMLSRDLGFDRGASPELVSEVERLAEEVVVWWERRGPRPERWLLWLEAPQAHPLGRFARPSDHFAALIARDSEEFCEVGTEAAPESAQDEPDEPG